MDIEIRPINPGFVAEIGGIDLSGSIDRPGVDAIWAAIDLYAVLVFREQRLDDTQLRDFAAHFGPLEIGRAAAGAAWRIPKSAISQTSTRTDACAAVTTGGASTPSAIGYGIPMLPTCRCRLCLGCSMRLLCHPRAHWVAARPNSPICVRPMTRCPRR